MAFTILVEGKTPKGEDAALEYKWKVGDKKPMPDSAPFWLQATGKELEHIRSSFDNVPITRPLLPNKPVRGDMCQWNGEMAEFIFNNL